MTATMAWLFGALALAILAASEAAGRLDRRRRELPELTVLCMSFERPRQARLELRVERPAASPDWSVRRVEWLAPQDVRIAGRADDSPAGPALETHLRPADPKGRRFAGAATIWASYPADRTPAHLVRLRLTLERADGRRRRCVISAPFPAMDWTPEAPPVPRELAAVPKREAAPRPAAAIGWEARSWSGRDAPRPRTEGIA